MLSLLRELWLLRGLQLVRELLRLLKELRPLRLAPASEGAPATERAPAIEAGSSYWRYSDYWGWLRNCSVYLWVFVSLKLFRLFFITSLICSLQFNLIRNKKHYLFGRVMQCYFAPIKFVLSVCFTVRTRGTILERLVTN